MSDVVLRKTDKQEGKVRTIEEKLFLSENFLKRIGENIAKELSTTSLTFSQVLWSKPIEIDLSTARSTPQFLERYIPGGDCIVYLPDSTGIATLYLGESTGYGYTMPTKYTKIRSPFSELYITNTAQPGKKLYLQIGKGDFSFESPISTPTIYNVVMTNANTEYSRLLPTGTRKFSVWCRDGSILRFAFEPGHVAGSVEPYGTILNSSCYYEDNVYLVNKTIYLACSLAGKTAIIVAYT